VIWLGNEQKVSYLPGLSTLVTPVTGQSAAFYASYKMVTRSNQETEVV